MFVASEAEINDLNDGRVRLEAQIEALEAKVGDLQQIREDAHTQSITEGAQYMKIMAMSSRLEAQGASDSQKFKAERNQWELEKKAFTAQIRHIENEKQKILHIPYGFKTSALSTPWNQSIATKIGTPEGVNTHASHPEDLMWDEVKRLRARCIDLEAALQALQQESRNFGQAFAELGAVGRRLHQHLQILTPNKAALPEENIDDLAGAPRGDSSMSAKGQG